MAESNPSDDVLRKAIAEVKSKNPEFGVKRIWNYLKTERGWEVSEKRVKKFVVLANDTEQGAELSSNSGAASRKEGPNKPEPTKLLGQKPSPRAYFSLTSCPDISDSSCKFSSDSPRLVMFGGEYYDGSKNFFYNDTFFLLSDSNRNLSWHLLQTNSKPPTRSAHQACFWRNSLYIFGGEWSSQNGEKFKLYDDLWRLDLSLGRWEKLGEGNGPSARSGHRMVCVNDKLVLYGGAQYSILCLMAHLKTIS